MTEPTDWANLIVVVEKASGQMRSCIDKWGFPHSQTAASGVFF